MLSLIRIGMPWSGPRTPFALRSLLRSEAIDSASGLSSITDLIAGPCLSTSSMRSRYFRTSDWAVYFPEAIPPCSSAMVNSSSSNAGGGGGGVIADAEVLEISLAAAVTLTLAKPTPPTTLLRTKVLRFMGSLDGEMMDRRHFYSEGRAKSNGLKRNVGL